MLAIPRIFLAAIMFVVMADLLVGVLLRYVVVPFTDYFDLPSVSFFWVEEVGEFGLAWLYGSAVAGGTLTAIYGVAVVLGIMRLNDAPLHGEA